MRLRNGSVLGVVIALCAMLSQSAQAESGRPSRQTLAQMGLGSLVVMSDNDALAVRGQGYKHGSYVRVSGSSWATIGNPSAGSHSEDSYFADGKHVAKGSSSSYAGVAHIWIGGKPGGHQDGGGYGGQPRSGDYGGGGHGVPVKIHATVYFSGGHSSAWAF